MGTYLLVLLMPIYEYQALKFESACDECRHGFEVLKKVSEKSLSSCIYCGQPVKKKISRCRSVVMKRSEENTIVENQIKEYEISGMWSHAAELADKHSEKTKTKNLKIRAIDNYKKAGYNADFLYKHLKLNNK